MLSFLEWMLPMGLPCPPMQARNPALTVSYCLPVLPSGLTADGEALLANAVAQGVRVDEVAVMTMVSLLCLPLGSAMVAAGTRRPSLERQLTATSTGRLRPVWAWKPLYDKKLIISPA